MKKFFAVALCAAGAMMLAANSAQASFISSILTNGLNRFEDQNRDALLDVDGDSTFSIGDVLIGFVRLDDHTSTGGVGPLANRIYGIFSQQVVDIIDNGTTRTVEFETTTQAGLTLQELTGDANTAGGMTAVYSGNVSLTNLIGTSPGDVNGDLVINMLDYIEAIVNGLSLTVVAGIVDVTPGFDGVDYFAAEVPESGGFIAPGVPFNTFDVGALAGLPFVSGTANLGSFSAGLTVTYNADASTVIYHDTVFDSIRGGVHELLVHGGSISGTSGTTNAGEWSFANAGYNSPGGFRTNADFDVNVSVVPEPSSMALFGLGMGVLGLYRRRKAAQAA